MRVCNIKTICLMVPKISSGNETRTHRRKARHGDDNILHGWGDKNDVQYLIDIRTLSVAMA